MHYKRRRHHQRVDNTRSRRSSMTTVRVAHTMQSCFVFPGRCEAGSVRHTTVQQYSEDNDQASPVHEQCTVIVLKKMFTGGQVVAYEASPVRTHGCKRGKKTVGEWRGFGNEPPCFLVAAHGVVEKCRDTLTGYRSRQHGPQNRSSNPVPGVRKDS